MGAGSAKGIRTNGEGEDSEDEFSSSSETWENVENPDDKAKEEVNGENNNKITTADVNNPGAGTSDADIDTRMDVEKKEEARRRGIFAFSRKKEDTVKVGDIVDELSNSMNNKDKEKKDGERRGFKLFNWKKGDRRTEAEGEESKAEEKDTHLDHDINELEKTFDSLGIVGKNRWAHDKSKGNKGKTVDDIELLEPMRNRKQMKPRPSKSMNGLGSTDADSHHSNTSRRTFRYSWETNEVVSPQQDEWEYQAVVIEGFDIDKFKRANMENDLLFEKNIVNTLPNSVKSTDTFIENNDDRGEARTPLKYDVTDQQILASIERDFAL